MPQVDLIMNARQFNAEAKRAGKSVDDISDSLDDVAREGDRAADKLERSFRDVASDAQRADRAIADVGDKGLRGLGDKGAEVSGELRQNLGETFSSFRGDLEDLPQIAQDTLGGLAGSGALGGIAGLAATAAGAAGLGLVIGAFDAIDEANEESQKRVAEWADRYIEAGGRVLSAGQIIAATNEILTDNEKFKQASEAHELWGVSLETAVLAMAGHDASIDAVSDSVDRQRKSYEKRLAAGEVSYEQQDKELKLLGDANTRYKELTDEMENGQMRADILSQAVTNVAQTTAGATTKVDEFGDSVINLPDGTIVYIDAETGQATTDTQAIENKIYGIQDKTVTVKVRRDTSDWDDWTPQEKTAYVQTRVTGSSPFTRQMLGG